MLDLLQMIKYLRDMIKKYSHILLGISVCLIAFIIFLFLMMRTPVENKSEVTSVEFYKNTDLKSDIEKELDSSSFAIDFEKMNIVSIERAIRHKKSITIFGYIDKDNILKEWVFYCSLDQHERIVDQYKRYLMDKRESKEGE